MRKPITGRVGTVLAVIGFLMLVPIPGADASGTDAATDWTELSPATSPSARAAQAEAFDSSTGDLVLFGGVGPSGFLDDTWTFDGSDWTQLFPSTSPSARLGASVAFDPA